ncbi:MAG: hypothetical protein KGL39_30875 [Patescibacteria group bacterium]|nr:hypothetical protein [Patescibacteria group bacterium]
MAFADALSILSGNTTDQAPVAPTITQTPEGRPHIYIYPRGQEKPPETEGTDFGGALSVLTNSDISPPASIAPTGPRQIGGVESFATGLKSGLTANFSDELAGASAAGKTMLPEGVNPKLSPLGEIISAAGGALRLGYEAIAGAGAGTAAYEKARDAERENQRLAMEQHPIANIAGNAAGALMLPVGGVAGAATLPGRIGAGAALGAGYGAAYGAGEGENLQDRASRAGTGALIGGAAGGVAPAILSGVGAAGKAIGGAVGTVLGHPIQTIRAGFNPEAEAARRVGTNIIADMRTGPGMSGTDLAAAHASGQPTAVMDVGSENTRALARSAANTSPAARSALEDMAGNRFSDQAQRISDFVRGLIPTAGNATRTQEAIDAAERAANKGAYARAYAAGDRAISSPELDRLMGSPAVISAIRHAAETGKSRAIADGLPMTFNKGKPTIQFWDYTYRSLRDAANAAFRAGRGDEGNTLKTLSNQLRTELDKIVPEYGKARGIASEFFQAENALEAGQKFVSMRGPTEEARIAHAKMTPAQRALFAEGFVSDLSDKVLKVANNRSVTIDRIFNSQDGKARIELALGKDKASDLEYFLRRENMMDMARTAIKGNSTTARQLIESGIAGGIGAAAGGAAEAAVTGKMDAKSLISAAVLGGASMGHRAINFKVAQRVGEMLASNDPKVLLTAIKMAKTNPDAGRAVRNAERILEKLSGQGSVSAGPLLPAQMSAVRADQQQQQDQLQ